VDNHQIKHVLRTLIGVIHDARGLPVDHDSTELGLLLAMDWEVLTEIICNNTCEPDCCWKFKPAQLDQLKQVAIELKLEPSYWNNLPDTM